LANGAVRCLQGKYDAAIGNLHQFLRSHADNVGVAYALLGESVSATARAEAMACVSPTLPPVCLCVRCFAVRSYAGVGNLREAAAWTKKVRSTGVCLCAGASVRPYVRGCTGSWEGL
jgi:hypothetical protein